MIYHYATGHRYPTRNIPAAITGVALPRKWKWALLDYYDVSETACAMVVAPVKVDPDGRVVVIGHSIDLPYDGREWSDPYAAL